MSRRARRGFGGRAVVALAGIASALLLGLAADANAAGDEGLLRLQLGPTNRFVYQAPGASLPDETIVEPFGFAGPGSCLLVWGTGSDLAHLTAAGNVKDTTPGFGPTSIGAWDGAKGTPCARVSKYAEESLAFRLGGDVTRTGGPIEANGFDRLELDVEVKADARLLLTLYLEDTVYRRYELRTGTSIVAGTGLPPLPTGQPQESTPGSPIVNCSARSDSGPDSGPNDNCRWVINDIGQSFTITPLVGEFSLEGGGDWAGTTKWFENNTLIYLTHLDEGTLTCGSSLSIDIGTGADGALCTAAGPPYSPSGSCPYYPIKFLLQDLTGTFRGCNLFKQPGNQMVGVMKIAFPREASSPLATMKKTEVWFPYGDGSYAKIIPELCTGTLVGTGDNLTVAEVLTLGDGLPLKDGSELSDYNDVIPGNGFIDYACIASQTVEHLLGKGWMQVSQTILVWGDPMGIRQ